MLKSNNKKFGLLFCLFFYFISLGGWVWISQMQNVLNALQLRLLAQHVLFLCLLVGFSPWGKEMSHTGSLGKSSPSLPQWALPCFLPFPIKNLMFIPVTDIILLSQWYLKKKKKNLLCNSHLRQWGWFPRHCLCGQNRGHVRPEEFHIPLERVLGVIPHSLPAYESLDRILLCSP